MSKNTRYFNHIESMVLLILALLITIPAGVAHSASSTPAETEAAKIAEALHSVVRAAKQYQVLTGKEATGIDQLVKAEVLKNPDKNVEMQTHDPGWQVWGDRTGAYVMWNKAVSAEVCRILNPGGTLPTDPPGEPDPDKGFQCVYDEVNGYYILEPVYIHAKPEPSPK